MKEYYIKLQPATGEPRILRKYLSNETAKYSQERIGKTDKHGITLVEFWEIKGISAADFMPKS